MTAPLLALSDVTVRYGPIPAVRDANLEVFSGEVVAVVGPNGAGKSTLLRAVAGLEPLSSGRICFRGHDLGRLPPHRRVREGIALVPQGRRVFPESTVEENLWAGAFARASRQEVTGDIEKMLALFENLARRRDSPAGVLSGGEQQMLALARALMSRPRLILLDEPSMGLAPVMIGRIYDILEELANQGTTMLLVEQNVARALQVSGRVSVLKSGEFAGHDIDTAMITADELITRYLSDVSDVPAGGQHEATSVRDP